MLGELGHPRAADAPLEAPRDRNSQVRKAGLLALAAVFEENMLPVLVERTYDPDDEVGGFARTLVDWLRDHRKISSP
jgi:hypothetical protein